MLIGLMADGHKNTLAVQHIVAKFKELGVGVILYAGDLDREHLDAKLFGGIPVIVALVDGQEEDAAFEENCPTGWRYTRHDQRVVKVKIGENQYLLIYLGHKRNTDFMYKTEAEFTASLNELRKNFDGLRIVLGGHLHFRTFKQGPLVSFINPGAAQGSIYGGGFQYAIYDTETGRLTFSSISATTDTRKPFRLAVISDSGCISYKDPGFWARLVTELERDKVTRIIHCGNLALTDIGRPELEKFVVHYAIREDQWSDHRDLREGGKIPSNWKAITEDNLTEGAIVDVPSEDYVYRVYVQLDLGLKLNSQSEYGMTELATEICRKYPKTELVLCGFNPEALLVEGPKFHLVNPGLIETEGRIAEFEFPSREVTFAVVPAVPLPPL